MFIYLFANTGELEWLLSNDNPILILGDINIQIGHFPYTLVS